MTLVGINSCRNGKKLSSYAMLVSIVGVDFFFHMFFLSRYCKLLEENSFRGRTADFLFMLLFGGFLLLIVAPYFRVQFLGSSLSFMMVCFHHSENLCFTISAISLSFQVYVWSRRNPFVQMNFLGLFSFTAPYLPWVCCSFTDFRIHIYIYHFKP